MKKTIKISSRTDYSKGYLDEKDCPADPFNLLRLWFDEAAISAEQEPSIVLSTVGKDCKPSSRVLLIKAINSEGLYFYSNYSSRKGRELEINPFVAATSFWPELERQLRIEGRVIRLSSTESDNYFNSRPEESRINAIISPQSQTIPNRDFLIQKQEDFRRVIGLGEIVLKRPENWGGYVLKPTLIEFWQGRPGRLNDRILYKKKESFWKISRLAP